MPFAQIFTFLPQKLKNAKNGDMVALEITFWAMDRKPEGKVVEVDR